MQNSLKDMCKTLNVFEAVQLCSPYHVSSIMIDNYQICGCKVPVISNSVKQCIHVFICVVLLNYFSLYNRRLELPVICAQVKVKTCSLCLRISGDCYFGGSPQGFPSLIPCSPASSQLSELKAEELVQCKWAQLCESFIKTLLDGRWSREMKEATQQLFSLSQSELYGHFVKFAN